MNRRTVRLITGGAARVQSRRYSQRNYASTVQNFDVVIVGGGPVGLALACALVSTQKTGSPQNYDRKAALRVALVDASDLSTVRNWSPGGSIFSNRVSSITNKSREFLQDIGAWQHVEQERTNPIEEMQVWDGLSGSRIEFNASSASGSPPEMARLVENINLQRGLLRQIDKSISAGILTLMDKTTVSSISSDADSSSPSSSGWPLLHLSTSQAIRARLLIGADGPSSSVRKFSKIESYGWPYNARAIVATLEHGRALSPFGTARNHTTAYQRFLPTGPIAFLPIAPERASLVWSTTPELAQALLDAGERVLSLMINAAFRLPDVSIQYLYRYILEKWGESAVKKSCVVVEELEREVRWREQSHGIVPNSALTSFRRADEEEGIPTADAGMYPPLVHSIQPQSAASFPLRMNHADAYVGNRIALVGDAAHTVHPLAGQGLNLGIADAEALARIIGRARLLGGDIGSYTALEGYPHERYLANHGMLSGVDKLAKLYGTRMKPVVWLRSAGLEVVNEWNGLKEVFMGVAGAGDNPMGRRGGFPEAAQLPKVGAAVIEGIGGLVDGGRKVLSTALGNLRR